MTSRAWRFIQPHFDSSDDSGLRISRTGGIEMVEGDASVRQALLLLITTRPGERLMRPSYGCDLNHLMFMPNDATTHGLAIHYVRQAIERWEPRITILHLDANADPQQEGKMVLLIKYTVKATMQIECLDYHMSLV